MDMEKTKEIIDYLKFSTKLRVLRYDGRFFFGC